MLGLMVAAFDSLRVVAPPPVIVASPPVAGEPERPTPTQTPSPATVEPAWYSTATCAKRAACSKKTIERRIQDGTLEAALVHNEWHVLAESFDRYVEAHRTQAKADAAARRANVAAPRSPSSSPSPSPSPSSPSRRSKRSSAR